MATKTAVLDMVIGKLTSIIVNFYEEKEPKNYANFFKSLQKTYSQNFKTLDETAASAAYVVTELSEKITELNAKGGKNTFVLDTKTYNVTRFLQAYSYTYHLTTARANKSDTFPPVTMAMLREVFYYLSVKLFVGDNMSDIEIDALVNCAIEDYDSNQVSEVEKYIKKEPFPLVVKIRFTDSIMRIKASKLKEIVSETPIETLVKVEESVVKDTMTAITDAPSAKKVGKKTVVNHKKKTAPVSVKKIAPLIQKQINKQNITNGEISHLFDAERAIFDDTTDEDLLPMNCVATSIGCKAFFDAWNSAIESGSSQDEFLLAIGNAFGPSVLKASSVVYNKLQAIEESKEKPKDINERVASLEDSIGQILALLKTKS